jgi:hypothetical protein
MDFAAYPNWNPYIKEISGEAKVGSKIKVYMKPDWEKKGVTLHPRIIPLSQEKSLHGKEVSFSPGCSMGSTASSLKKFQVARYALSRKRSSMALQFLLSALHGL